MLDDSFRSSNNVKRNNIEVTSSSESRCARPIRDNNASDADGEIIGLIRLCSCVSVLEANLAVVPCLCLCCNTPGTYIVVVPVPYLVMPGLYHTLLCRACAIPCCAVPVPYLVVVPCLCHTLLLCCACAIPCCCAVPVPVLSSSADSGRAPPVGVPDPHSVSDSRGPRSCCPRPHSYRPAEQPSRSTAGSTRKSTPRSTPRSTSGSTRRSTAGSTRRSISGSTWRRRC